MDKQAVTDTRVDRRDHVGLFVEREAHVTDHRFVEDRFDRTALVVPARGITLDLRAFRWFETLAATGGRMRLSFAALHFGFA